MQRYATFAGPRLPTVISSHGNIALIGDASHPLSGAFGAGAGFALEDAHVLARSLAWANSRFPQTPITEALQLFDQIRSPHYKGLYGVLDRFKAVGETLADPDVKLNGDEQVAVVVATNWGRGHDWILEYDVTADFSKAAAQADIDRGLLENTAAGKVRTVPAFKL